MEEHDAFAGGKLVEVVTLVLASAPNPQHVEVGVGCVAEQSLDGVAAGGREVWVGEARVHHIWRHVVGPLAVDRIPVYFYLEVGPLGVQLNCPDPIHHSLPVQSVPILRQGGLELVEIRLTDVIGPPESRLPHYQFEAAVFGLHLQCHLLTAVFVEELHLEGPGGQVLVGHSLEDEGEVQGCVRLGYFFVADPDEVELGLIVEGEGNGQPYSQGVHIGRPVPRILIASLARVRVLKRHAVHFLPLRVQRLGTPEVHRHHVLPHLQPLPDFILILQEGVAGLAQLDAIEKYSGIGVDSCEFECDPGVGIENLVKLEGLAELGAAVRDCF